MPHLSKKTLSGKIIQELDDNLVFLLSNTFADERRGVFREILTKTERFMIAKRISLILLVDRGLSPYAISNYLGISPSTAEKFSRKIQLGQFKKTVEWLHKNKNEKGVKKFIIDLISIPFEAQHRSLKQMLTKL